VKSDTESSFLGRNGHRASVPQSFNGTLHIGSLYSLGQTFTEEVQMNKQNRNEKRSTNSSALKQTTIEESVVERMILVVTYLPTIPREYPVPC